MRLPHLKNVRVVVSLLVFVIAAGMFLDFTGNFPRDVASTVTSVQVGPSLIRILTTIAWPALGLGIALILTIAFGRVYCSSLCPLGTLQDILSRLNRNRNSRRRFRFRRQYYLLHYALLLLASALALGGSIMLITLLEPFSTFGRLTVELARPAAVLLHNGAALVLDAVAVYSLFAVPLHVAPLGPLLVTILLLAVLFVMSYRAGRLFCNTLCPVGAILGLISRVSVFRIVFDRSLCSDCGLCEKVCKAGCIDSKRMSVDFSACVGCFNCMEVCPTSGVLFERRYGSRNVTAALPVDRRRRKMLQDAAAMVAGSAIMPGDSLKAVLPPATGKSRTTRPITPPGSRGLDHFTSRCTACHLCVSACPTQILTPVFLDYGLDGILQPCMDYEIGSCSYDCVVCGEVCPSGAILPLPVETKKLVQIGKATFIKDECIVVTKKTDCGACAEHCPTKAVRMVPYEGRLRIPELNNDLCIGCGACEHPCPTTPNKAIYVEANPVHLIAKKPEEKKIEVKEEGAEFPF
ncbi:MAG: 4Fe-4S binding protein [Bacteroidota bacterium]